MEAASLVCPCSLYIEVGKRDHMFKAGYARPPARRVAKVYERLGISDRFCYHEHEGGHDFNKSDEGIDFLCRHLRV